MVKITTGCKYRTWQPCNPENAKGVSGFRAATMVLCYGDATERTSWRGKGSGCQDIPCAKKALKPYPGTLQQALSLFTISSQLSHSGLIHYPSNLFFFHNLPHSLSLARDAMKKQNLRRRKERAASHVPQESQLSSVFKNDFNFTVYMIPR
jgi:hypothetical protein